MDENESSGKGGVSLIDRYDILTAWITLDKYLYPVKVT